MANRNFSGDVRSIKRGVVKLYGAFTTTTSGTLSTTAITPVKKAGFSLTKTATKTGRYTVQLGTAANPDKYQGLIGAAVIVSGAADAAYPAANGRDAFVRNVAVSTTGTLDIQMARTDTGADAEVLDGATIYIELTLDNSSV